MTKESTYDPYIPVPCSMLLSREFLLMNPLSVKIYFILVGEDFRPNRNSKVRISYAKIRHYTGAGYSQISESLNQLSDAGFIDIERQYKSHNLYQIRHDKLIACEIDNADLQFDFPSEPKKGYIYILLSENLYKIGQSISPIKRLNRYVTENPSPVKLILLVKIINYMAIESAMLDMFSDKQHHGEWFNLSEADIETAREFLLGNGGLFIS